MKVTKLGTTTDYVYDISEKSFKVLCRSGWVQPAYIYHHKTDKLECNF